MCVHACVHTPEMDLRGIQEEAHRYAINKNRKQDSFIIELQQTLQVTTECAWRTQVV